MTDNDLVYEFDAPKLHNFRESIGTTDSSRHADEWFTTHVDGKPIVAAATEVGVDGPVDVVMATEGVRMMNEGHDAIDINDDVQDNSEAIEDDVPMNEENMDHNVDRTATMNESIFKSQCGKKRGRPMTIEKNNKKIIKKSSIIKTKSIKTTSLTIPQSPCFRTNKRHRANDDQLPTEDAMLQVAQKEVEQAKKEREETRKRLPELLQKKVITMPARSTKTLTQPTEFHFRSDARIKTHGMLTRSAVSPPKNDYKSTAKMIQDFQTKTPARFHTTSSKQGPVVPTADTNVHLTCPQSPKFATDARHRNGHQFPTQEQREAAQLVDMQEHQFKARPLDRRVLESNGDLGVPRIPKKHVTEVECFSLATDTRALTRPAHAPADDMHDTIKQFKARPLPKTMDILPTIESKALTIPESPILATGRGPLKGHLPVPEPEPFIFKARPILSKSMIVTSHNHDASSKKLTEPIGFNLASMDRHLAYQRHHDEELAKQQKEEEEARHFKARPMMIGDPFKVKPSEAPVPTLTEFHEFHLESVRRHHQAEEAWQQQLAHQQKAEEDARNFKARSVPTAIHHPPKPAEKSSKPLTEVDESFVLASDKRAEERRVFDEMMAARERQALLQRVAEQEILREEQENDVKELRKTMVPKLVPMVTGHGLDVKPSTKKLTEPDTPHLRVKERARRVPLQQQQ